MVFVSSQANIRNRDATAPPSACGRSGKGRAVLYVDNPIYRWQTFGEPDIAFNALLFDDLPAPGSEPETTL